ncbi:MAG: class I SAM-dependent methyltransferase [Planctomycetes bacterium]|nr:class I SAM-dependent methyltransferase [Planctomycetota bacterium]
MNAADISLYEWLVSSRAEPWLAEAAGGERPLATQARDLRKHLSAEQTHLVLELAKLRRRAAAKFSHAERMFFTPRALEQATSEGVARWKAQRTAARTTKSNRRAAGPTGAVVDLCCGIGGDLLALAGRGSATGVDRDPIVALLAGANLAARGLAESEVRCCDVRDLDIAHFAAWHLDPDRRTDRGRVAQPEFAAPGLDTIEGLLSRHPDGAVKLAPAARVPEAWRHRAELEWISERGECRQQVAWFGGLAATPGVRAATALDPDGVGHTFRGRPESETAVAASWKRCLVEPDTALLAAGLSAAWAAHHGLEAAAPGVAYYTCDRPPADSLAAVFEITDVAPLDRKRLKSLLRERRVGALEIKKRGVEIDLERLRAELRVPGDESATLLIAPRDKRITAILARRLHSDKARDLPD